MSETLFLVLFPGWILAASKQNFTAVPLAKLSKHCFEKQTGSHIMRVTINLHKKKSGENFFFVPGLINCDLRIFHLLFCSTPLWYHISLISVKQSSITTPRPSNFFPSLFYDRLVATLPVLVSFLQIRQSDRKRVAMRCFFQEILIHWHLR